MNATKRKRLQTKGWSVVICRVYATLLKVSEVIKRPLILQYTSYRVHSKCFTISLSIHKLRFIMPCGKDKYA